MIHRIRLSYACTLIGLISFIGCMPAWAHHSRANFELDRTVEIKGTVSDFTFKSPHVWFDVIVELDGKAINYVVEGGSTAALRRHGWSANSIKEGEYITVYGNPDRNPKRKLIYLDRLVLTDGTILKVSGATSTPSHKKLPAKITPSLDFSGTWKRVATKNYFYVGAFDAPKHLPVNAKGKALVEDYDINNDPMMNCISPTLPRLAYAPFRHQWKRDGDTLMIGKELSPHKRKIMLGNKEWPNILDPSRMGTSRGWINEDGSLSIETKGFVADKWGLYRGIDSSAAKYVTEVYALINGGMGMELTLTITDPEYLTKPYTEVWNFEKIEDTDQDLAGLDCDLTSARRHLELEKEMERMEEAQSDINRSAEQAPERVERKRWKFISGIILLLITIVGRLALYKSKK